MCIPWAPYTPYTPYVPYTLISLFPYFPISLFPYFPISPRLGFKELKNPAVLGFVVFNGEEIVPWCKIFDRDPHFVIVDRFDLRVEFVADNAVHGEADVGSLKFAELDIQIIGSRVRIKSDACTLPLLGAIGKF